MSDGVHPNLTPAEVDAVDPSAVDAVTAVRLIATIRQLRESGDFLSRSYESATHAKVALWLADLQGELPEAASWIVNEVYQWIDADEIATDPWAHDWRRFWNSRDSITGRPAKPCGICGAPGTIWSSGFAAACCDRHWKALRGELPDEQCRLCNEVVVCAHDLNGSPVCADCWPGERLLAEKRAAFAKQVSGE